MTNRLRLLLVVLILLLLTLHIALILMVLCRYSVFPELPQRLLVVPLLLFQLDTQLIPHFRLLLYTVLHELIVFTILFHLLQALLSLAALFQLNFGITILRCSFIYLLQLLVMLLT